MYIAEFLKGFIGVNIALVFHDKGDFISVECVHDKRECLAIGEAFIVGAGLLHGSLCDAREGVVEHIVVDFDGHGSYLLCSLCPYYNI